MSRGARYSRAPLLVKDRSSHQPKPLRPEALTYTRIAWSPYIRLAKLAVGIRCDRGMSSPSARGSSRGRSAPRPGPRRTGFRPASRGNRDRRSRTGSPADPEARGAETSCSGEPNGGGRSSTPQTALNSAAMAPFPSARVATAASEEVRWRRRRRRAKRRSCGIMAAPGEGFPVGEPARRNAQKRIVNQSE